MFLASVLLCLHTALYSYGFVIFKKYFPCVLPVFLCRRWQFPKSLIVMDMRISKQVGRDVLLSPLFQELGRLARYSEGEDSQQLPMAFVSASLHTKLKDGLAQHCNITDMIRKGGCVLPFKSIVRCMAVFM